MGAMAAFRTLWLPPLSLYEETLGPVGLNFATLAFNAPLGLALFLVALPFISEEDAQLLAVLIAWLVPFLPTPGNVALAGVTRIAAGPEIPRFAEFRAALSAHWRLALRCFVISLVI